MKRWASTLVRIAGVLVLLGGVALTLIDVQGDDDTGVPPAVHPQPEVATAQYLELQRRAIAQPTGVKDPESAPFAPAVASPKR